MITALSEQMPFLNEFKLNKIVTWYSAVSAREVGVRIVYFASAMFLTLTISLSLFSSNIAIIRKEKLESLNEQNWRMTAKYRSAN